MSLSGAGYGATMGMEAVLERRFRELMRQQQEAQRAEQLDLQRQTLASAEQDRAEGRELQRKNIDLNDLARRDRNNQQGLETMQQDRAQMDQDAILQSLPTQARQRIDLRRIGGNPDDLITPEERAATEAAAKEAAFTEWKRKQDYDEQQLRGRPKEPKPSGPGGLTTAQGNTALKFQDDYARDSKPYLTMRDAYQRVKSANTDAAGDLSLIFAYMKLLDPNSVVREQEFANAQNATGVPDRIRNTYNNLMKGERLNPEQRQQFLSQAEGLFGNARTNQQKVRQTYGSRAKQWEIPESMVLDAEDEAPPPLQRPIPSIPGAIAESTDGGKTWKRVK